MEKVNMDSHREGKPPARRRPALFGGLLVMVSCVLVTPARAQSAEEIAKSGTSAGAPACSSCHGAQGEGMPAAGFPQLAGLDAGYLLRQLQDLADGQRSNPVMSGVAKLLSEPDRKSLSSYYAQLELPDASSATGGHAAPPADATAQAAGERLAQHGDWSRGIPACTQCHGPDGLGVGDGFPRIAGQSASYIENQLRTWQSGARHGDPMALMQGVASRLTDADIGAVASYLASLPSAGSAPSKVNP
jgi:cytochrome c553